MNTTRANDYGKARYGFCKPAFEKLVRMEKGG